MNILFVSGELIAGDLALRLQAEGNAVKLWVAHPLQQECLRGMIPRTLDWKAELGWVGKDGLIVFDDVGYGEEQDALRLAGYRVVGGSAGGDRLELDRAYAQEVFASVGMQVQPTHNFATAQAALDFVSAQGGAWVVKQNDHQSHLNYVGALNDGRDVHALLMSYQKLGIGNLSVQRRLNGIEVGVGRYFNGEDWVGPIEVNQEHKGLMNGEIGPKTGEMGTLMWYEQGQCRLFEATLGRLKDHLRGVNFRGDVDINCIVNGDVAYPLEATMRFGCPSTHLQTTLHQTSWTELLGAVADGRACDVKTHQGYCVGLTLAVPPFPYDAEQAPGVSSVGMPLLTHRPLTRDETQRLHLEGLAQHEGAALPTVVRNLGYIAFVTGLGASVQEAQAAAYGLTRQLVIPKLMYRTDIGQRFIDGEGECLRKGGWI